MCERACVCVCERVCVCDSLKEHVVANSALYVVTVNVGMHRNKNSGPKQNSGCSWSKTENSL